MTYKTLLVPFYGTEKELPALEAAFMIAKQFNAHITCLHTSPKASPFIFGEGTAMVDIYDDIRIEIERDVQRQAEYAHALFEKTARKYDVTIIKQLPKKQTNAGASWHHEIGIDADKVIARFGKLADIIVVSRVITEQHESYRDAIVAALFETGRPVVLMPTSKPPKAIGQHIAIAWDGSPRSIHAVAIALPFLKNAKKVQIITIAENDKEGPLAQDLTLYLQVHNIKSEHVSIKQGSLSVGSALMDKAKHYNSDLIVMGAFTHSRIREMVMGGATSFMLDHAELPVFMMH